MIGVLVKDVVIMDLSGRLEVLFVSAGLSGTISIGDVSNARCLKYLVIVFCCIFIVYVYCYYVFFFATFNHVRIDSSFIYRNESISLSNNFLS